MCDVCCPTKDENDIATIVGITCLAQDSWGLVQENRGYSASSSEWRQAEEDANVYYLPISFLSILISTNIDCGLV